MTLALDPQTAAQIPAAVLLAAEKHQRPGALCVLLLPFDPGPHGANRQRGKHWGQRVSHDDQPAQMAALWAYRGAGDPRLRVPVVVEVLVCRGRQMDDDNILAALKPARDQLCRCGLLPDDGPAWWKYGGVEQVVNREVFRQAWTVLVVYERGERT